MRLKSFFADSVEQAISLARREMGPDAMLLNSKRSGPEALGLGAYEVVCAVGTETAGDGESSEAKGMPANLAPPVERLLREVSEVKQQMERLARSLARCGIGMAGAGSDPELANAFVALTEAELEPDLAYEVIGRINSPVASGALRTQLRRLVNVQPDLGCPGAPQKIAVLVGPPGAGKTSCLVKLAVQYGISARKRVQLLSLDTHRIAAAEELQSYSAILGIGCQVFESTAALTQALGDHGQKDLILIDTPGLSRGEMDEDLARFIAATPGFDTHLVLPASMRTSDLKRASDQYAAFKPSKLLFTRLDETQTFGPLLGQSVRLGIPISFLSSGQRIPEDLEAAGPDLLLDLVLKSEPVRTPNFGVAAA